MPKNSNYATKADIKEIKDSLKNYATKDDIKEIKDSLKNYATKDDIQEALKNYATKDDIQEIKDTLLLLVNSFNDFKKEVNARFDRIESCPTIKKELNAN